MKNVHGGFIWYELMTTDLAKAAMFYGEVADWKVRDSGMSNMDYRLCSADEDDIAGMMELPAAAREGGTPPMWLGYVGVDDVDASVAQLVAAGGKVHMPAADIPGVGRFAMVADPQGPLLYVMRGASAEPSRAFAANVRGHFSWNELYAANGEEAFSFYSKMFGWKKVDAVDMGAMGAYQLFGTKSDQVIGGMMTRPKEVPVPMWLYYINVDDIDAALARVKSAGGTPIHGPSEVPGGQMILQALDPQGAMFALVADKKV